MRAKIGVSLARTGQRSVSMNLTRTGVLAIVGLLILLPHSGGQGTQKPKVGY